MGNGIGIDGGFLIRLDGTKLFEENSFLGKILFGITCQNIANTSIKWSSGHQARMFYNLKVSLGYEQPLPKFKSAFYFIYNYNTRYKDQQFGVEYCYQNLAFLRAGWNQKDGFSTGAGLKRWGILLDYAFCMADLANSHQINIGYEF